MSDNIMETQDLKSVRFVASMVVEEREIGLIYGAPGAGKTVALGNIIPSYPEAVLVEGYDRINVLKELCGKLNIDPKRTNDDRFADLRDYLSRQPAPIFVDEAEKISYRGLEWLRRLWDFCRMPLLLVGTETLYENMRGSKGQRRQLFRRVRAKWEMQGLSFEEVERVCDRFGYSSHKKISTMCGNNFDKAVNILTKMKRFADSGKMDINKIDVKQVARFIIL